MAQRTAAQGKQTGRNMVKGDWRMKFETVRAVIDVEGATSGSFMERAQVEELAASLGVPYLAAHLAVHENFVVTLEDIDAFNTWRAEHETA